MIEEKVEEDNYSEEYEDLTFITRKFKKFTNDERYKERRFVQEKNLKRRKFHQMDTKRRRI